MRLVRDLLSAQQYWRVKGLRVDLVILNEHPSDYLDEPRPSSPALWIIRDSLRGLS
jgi:cyclic beta-1,2-glucan synthetase